MAARIRNELQTQVDLIPGHYGEYKVLVDGETVVDGGRRVILGILPPARKTLDEVRARLYV